MNLACKHAMQNRNVSHLIFPNEVQTIEAAADARAGGPEGRLPDQRILPPKSAVSQALTMLRESKQPGIIVGHGARFEMPAIIELAERLNAPVITTFKAKGQISDSHPLGCGVLGRSGTPVASWLMNEADFLLVFGASFSNHTGITFKLPLIQVDRDPLALGKFHKIDCPIFGDIAETIGQLVSGLSEQGGEWADRREVIAQRWKIWKAEKENRAQDDLGKGINSAAIFAAMNRLIPKNAVIAVDVGNNTYSFGRYFEVDAQSVLMSGYLGSIGFGFPAAMGAWAATRGSRPIIAVTGDGGFAQYMGELTTAVKYNMNITHVLINNSQLGKISKEQRDGHYEMWGTELHNPNFADYATNCGALGIRVTAIDQLDKALEQALAHDGPALVEIIADPGLI